MSPGNVKSDQLAVERIHVAYPLGIVCIVVVMI